MSEKTWQEDVAPRLLLGLAGALLLNTGFKFWATLAPQALLTFVPIIILYSCGIILIHFAVTDVAHDQYRWLAGLALAALLVATLSALAINDYLPRLGTDAIAFSKYAASLLIHGSNPYTASMAPATKLAGYPAKYATPQLDGTIVTSVSYPAGSLVVFVAPIIAGVQARMVPLAAVIGIGALVSWDVPRSYALAGPLAITAGSPMVHTAVGGIIDPIWVLPLMLSMRAANNTAWRRAGAWYGLSAAIKQQPWICAPFLLIFLYRHDPRDQWRQRMQTAVGSGLIVFGAINLPFIVWNPQAWITSVVTPVAGSAPMVNLGVGLTLLTMGGVIPLPTWWYALAVLSVTGWLLVAYWLYWPRVKWLAWIVPMAILFVHYRSLASYFSHFVPIALYAVFLGADATREKSPIAAIKSVVP